MNLCTIKPFWTAVSSVGYDHRGDNVGIQQVHSPPGVGLLISVDAWSSPIVRLTISINGIAGICELKIQFIWLGSFST